MKITKTQLKQIIKEELQEMRAFDPSQELGAQGLSRDETLYYEPEAPTAPGRPFAAVYKILQNRDISWSGTKVYNVLSEIFSSLPNQEEAWKITAELFAAADWSAMDPID